MTVFVMAGDRRVGRGDGMLAVLGLGSCVAVVLYDEAARVGGLAHVLLPDPSYSAEPEKHWRFATTAVPALVMELEKAGADRRRLKARLIGGACMFQDLLANDGPQIGARNVAAAREALAESGIAIVGEEVGGDFGRSIHFDLSSGRVRVSSQVKGDIDI